MKTRALLTTIMIACLVLALCGCNAAGAKAPAGDQASPVEAARDKNAVASDGTVKPVQSASANDRVAPSAYSYDDAEVDVDLTQMSSTAIYSAVYQMMVDPQSYQGKVVKMKGVFYSQYDDSTKRRYFFVVVQDATACCAQGIEFVWDDGGHAYPDDYPEENAEVVVCGRFGTYAERSSQFAYLSQSSLELAGA